MKQKKLSLQQIAMNFYKNRNEKNFEMLYQRLKPGLINYIKQNYGYDDEQIKESILTKVFSIIWKKIDMYNPKYAFSTWVYRIARNEAFLSRRYENRIISFEKNKRKYIKNDNNLYYDLEEEYIRNENEEKINRLYEIVLEEINKLPKKYKIVITESLINKKKEKEIAELQGWNINTIKTRKRKAKQLIAEKINKNYPELLKIINLSL